MVMNKAFINAWIMVLVEALWAKEKKKAISKISMYSNDDRSLPQPRWQEHNIINPQ